MDEEDPSIAQTYRGLRVGMVVLVLLLFGSVLFEIVRTGVAGQLCLQPSISAYYYTPARPVFVAALSAVGAGLIIYRGTTAAENVLLDFAGFFAFVVAFVPTKIGTNPCGTSNVPIDADITAAEANNVLVLLVIGVVAVVASLMLGRGRGRYTSTGKPVTESARASAALCLAALAVGLILFVFARATFVKYGHQLAAAALFGAILVVMFVNAADAARHAGAGAGHWYRSAYAVVGIATTLAVVLTWLVSRAVPGFTIWVFVVETEMIVGFAVFWAVQTVELGGRVRRVRSPAG
ncbi:MAG: hypothetical protein JOY78_14230 [Pseudonocardia sp.]|nr:hypothetical protein [Pseudonocardia sp.]